MFGFVFSWGLGEYISGFSNNLISLILIGALATILAFGIPFRVTLKDKNMWILFPSLLSFSQVFGYILPWLMGKKTPDTGFILPQFIMVILYYLGSFLALIHKRF
jgi:hypothetical protein